MSVKGCILILVTLTIHGCMQASKVDTEHTNILFSGREEGVETCWNCQDCGCTCAASLTGYTVLCAASLACSSVSVSDGSMYGSSQCMSDFPTWIPSHTTELYLTSMNFTLLSTPNVSSLVNLRELHIKASNVNSVERGFFNLFPRLKNLEMQYNLMNRVEPFVFMGSMELRIINLSNNRIETVEFPHLPSLKYLYLSNNLISNMTETMFSGIESLTYLSL